MSVITPNPSQLSSIYPPVEQSGTTDTPVGSIEWDNQDLIVSPTYQVSTGDFWKSREPRKIQLVSTIVSSLSKTPESDIEDLENQEFETIDNLEADITVNMDVQHAENAARTLKIQRMNLLDELADFTVDLVESRLHVVERDLTTIKDLKNSYRAGVNAHVQGCS